MTKELIWERRDRVLGVRARYGIVYAYYIRYIRLSRCRACDKDLCSISTSVSLPPLVRGRAVQLQAMGSPRPRRPLQLQLPMAPPLLASSTAWPATCILFLSQTVSTSCRSRNRNGERDRVLIHSPLEKLWKAVSRVVRRLN